MPVSTLASTTVVRTRPQASLRQLATAMRGADVGILVVGERGTPAAVVSERDIVRALANGADPDATTASAVAHSDLVWCEASAPVADVAREMMVSYVRHVLVENDGHLVGVVSARDILGAYASLDAGAAEPDAG